MAIKALNGWQRLFMLIAVLYAVPITMFAIANYPKDLYTLTSEQFRRAIAKHEDLASWDRISLADRLGLTTETEAVDSLVSDPDPWRVTERASMDPSYEGVPDEELTPEALKDKSLKRLAMLILNPELEKDFKKIALKHRLALRKNQTSRVEFIFTAIGFYVGPLLILYILGASVGWVFRGFRKVN